MIIIEEAKDDLAQPGKIEAELDEYQQQRPEISRNIDGKDHVAENNYTVPKSDKVRERFFDYQQHLVAVHKEINKEMCAKQNCRANGQNVSELESWIRECEEKSNAKLYSTRDMIVQLRAKRDNEEGTETSTDIMIGDAYDEHKKFMRSINEWRKDFWKLFGAGAQKIQVSQSALAEDNHYAMPVPQ